MLQAIALITLKNISLVGGLFYMHTLIPDDLLIWGLSLRKIHLATLGAISFFAMQNHDLTEFKKSLERQILESINKLHQILGKQQQGRDE
jgi:hypothetical protein